MITAAAEAYLSSPTPTLAYVLTLNAGFGAKQLAEIDLGSSLRGTFTGRIRNVSDITIGPGDWTSGVEARQVRVDVEDIDRDFSALLQGRYGPSMYGAPVTIELASPDLAPGVTPGLGDWPLVFTGIYDHAEQGRSGALALILRTDDRPLQKALCLPVITPTMVPYATSPVLGSITPLIYGNHDSRALVGTVEGTNGSLPTLYVGDYLATGWRYFVCMAPMFHIERVFKDGVFVSPAGNYQKAVLLLGDGVLATVVTFQASQGNSKITVDGIGLHPDIVGGAQHPYTTPTAIMRHILNNFVYQAWRSDVSGYFGDAAAIDTPSWDAADAYAIRQNLRASLYIGNKDAKTKASEFLQSFATEHGLRLYWTPANKLAIAIRDQAATAVYATGSRWFQADEMEDPAAVDRVRPTRDETGGISRQLWSLAQEDATRSSTLILAPGATGLAVEPQSTRFAPSSPYLDRNMLAPAGIRVAAAASRVGFFVPATPSGLKDGVALQTWNGHYNGFNTRRDWQNANASQRPILKLGRVNGRAAVSFDGVDDRLFLTTDTANGLCNLNPARWQVLVVFRVRSISSNNADPSLNQTLICDDNQAFGISFRNNAGVLTVGSWAIVAGPAMRTPAPKPITLNTWNIARLRSDATGIRFALNDTFGESIDTAGSLSGTSGTPRLGASYNNTAFFDGDIAEVHLYNNSPMSGSGNWSFFAEGGALEWLMFESLKRDYGIATH